LTGIIPRGIRVLTLMANPRPDDLEGDGGRGHGE